jgi:long-chain acyl-CoA synthetase
MLVVPAYEQLEPWARQRGLTWQSRSELIGLAGVRSEMERQVLGELRDLARYEMPKKVLLLEHDFSIEAGDLTPTLKVKRRVVEQPETEGAAL